MSYLTLEAQIDDGKIVVKEPEKLPQSARALVTILAPTGEEQRAVTPLEALEALQEHLKLDARKMGEWMKTVREARR